MRGARGNTDPTLLLASNKIPRSSSEGHRVRSQDLRFGSRSSQHRSAAFRNATFAIKGEHFVKGEAFYRTRSYTLPRTPGLQAANVFERFRDMKVALAKASAQGSYTCFGR